MVYLCPWTGVLGMSFSDVFADALTLTLKEVRLRALNFASPKSKQKGDPGRQPLRGALSYSMISGAAETQLLFADSPRTDPK